MDDVGLADALRYPEGSFDLVLCIQVFEHLEQPDRAVRELHRVLAPGGLALVSTHGVHVYHPSPGDYFRWTHAGLELLFRTNAAWEELRVHPNRNAVACLATLLCWYADSGLERLGAGWLKRAVNTTVNALAEPLDARYPPTLRVPAPGSLTANYLVAAIR